MVGVIEFTLNDDLAHFLWDAPDLSKHKVANQAFCLYLSYPPSLYVRDRLSDRDIAHLFAEFKAGTPKHELAKKYGIGMGSLKKLLREAGVKKRSRYDLRA